MAQREWVEKDFYKELGVSSDATPDEVNRAARKILAENHPDRNPANKAAETGTRPCQRPRKSHRCGQAQRVRRNPTAVRRRWLGRTPVRHQWLQRRC